MDQGNIQWKKGVRFTALTDIGLRRANNQDSHAVHIAATARQWLDRGHLFIVADGMGAHAAGEVASRLAAETIVQTYLRRTNRSPQDALVLAVYDAHRMLREKSRAEEAYRDMGTTCDAFVMLPEGLVIAHVGDSRVYRIRGPIIEQLTFDHSLVWEVCLATNLPFDQAPSYIPKNQITRSIGPTDKLVVDLEGPFPIAVGDIFLSCSDGLSGQVADREIGELLNVFPPEAAAETLINLANLRGGPDNITVVITQATQNQQTAEEVDAEMQIKMSSWAILAIAVMGFLGGLGAMAYDQPIPALVAAGLGGLFGLVFFVKNLKTLFGRSPFVPSFGPAGKGPYIKTPCAPSAGFTETLAKILQELRQATVGNQLSIKSSQADQSERLAVKARNESNYPVAIREYASAINHLMRELKKLSVKKK